MEIGYHQLKENGTALRRKQLKGRGTRKGLNILTLCRVGATLSTLSRELQNSGWESQILGSRACRMRGRTIL